MRRSFIAFIPLSNWLRGFDRYAMVYSKALIPESRFPDAFYMLAEDEPWTVGLGKARALIGKLGRANDRVLALRADLPIGGEGMSPNTVTGTGIGWRWPQPSVPLASVAWVDEADTLLPTCHEEVTAQAYRVSDEGLRAWADCRPRSFSVLPIARACQARCWFCFSKASVSELARQRQPALAEQVAWAEYARVRGAERAVITGGGEPTLMRGPALLELVAALRERFATTLLITNGATLDRTNLRALVDAGLTTLAISRHGLTPANDAAIMGLAVDSAVIASWTRALGLRSRAICVVQRGGVDSRAKVREYLERSASEGFDQVCFKELYVASVAENPWALGAVNRECEARRVPLSIVIEALRELGFELGSRLPWGSPVFVGELAGRPLEVAAYTEPSVGWERTQGLVRSWNLLADGRCLASLEDPDSVLDLPASGARNEA